MVVLTSCAPSQNGAVVNGQNESVPSSSKSSESKTIEINIPNNPTNSDLFKQIFWTAMGGGDGFSMGNPQVNCSSCNVDNRQDYATLSNFEPNQSLEIVVYNERQGDCSLIGDFYGTYEVIVDNNGRLNLSFLGNYADAFIYSVYDKNSGILEWQRVLPLGDSDCRVSDNSTQTNYPCSNGINTRLEIGDTARVTYTNGKPVRLRTDPIINSSTFITQLDEGTSMQVIGGPSCNDDFVWWYIQSGNNKGWIAEGTSGNWFIEPIN